MTGRMAKRMEGKKVVVVGAGQQPGGAMGNGHAIANVLAREGAEVCAVDFIASRAEDTVKEIVGAGGQAHAVVADVSKPEDCARLITESHAAMGRIDALVHNVGHNEGDADAISLEVDDWQRLLDVNLRAMWLTARAVLPIMQEQRSGSITTISSIGGRIGGGPLFAYGISKCGVEALSHSLAVNYAAWGVRSNCVILGRIDTPHSIEGHHWRPDPGGPSREEVVNRSRQFVPLGRIGTAWDVANAVLFLASDEASYITGVNLPVDGGALAIVGNYQRPASAPPL